VITQRQVRIGTTTATATLALSAALNPGGVAGYAVRGHAQPGDAVTSTPAPQVGDPHTGSSPDPTNEDWRIDRPVIALDRLGNDGVRLIELRSGRGLTGTTTKGMHAQCGGGESSQRPRHKSGGQRWTC